MIFAPVRRFLAWLAAAFAGLGLAWIAGRRNGAVVAENKALRKTEKDLMTAKEVEDANNAKTDAAVTADLRRWLRPD